MNRKDFQEIALMREQDAFTLNEHGRYDGAYYLAGYVLECALKACIAKKTKEHDFPPNKKTIQNIYTHNLNTLLKEAGLSFPDKDIEGNWGTVKDWSEEARYKTHNEEDVSEFIIAALDPEEGIFQWLKTHW
ncbi:HEPN domain-containing protein [Bacillus subtilis]|uniref:HEPN domain-containing protein n=1 Tax=Bacillus subtilis TaxID=1423 RepID=A0AC61YYZ2_BACIU|nr:HEPN domain-containing protein [Bacillus subtilis]ASB71470.1 hypothetical protein S100333_03606 [Bacillus subtilis subsp. subtilis]MDH3117358.1 HEPN domain-containing protein [Bacillus subtilis]MEC0287082.1 HEPN domain-containing protein [Bacillus subtilis]MEC0391289.1 HEPN domain-containing protein [Bacillus subtilis]MEC0416682.1 HEPN domain-containing protein [Bacillus subtilis]